MTSFEPTYKNSKTKVKYKIIGYIPDLTGLYRIYKQWNSPNYARQHKHKRRSQLSSNLNEDTRADKVGVYNLYLQLKKIININVLGLPNETHIKYYLKCTVAWNNAMLSEVYK